jgi:hypothetical protein
MVDPLDVREPPSEEQSEPPSLLDEAGEGGETQS